MMPPSVEREDVPIGVARIAQKRVGPFLRAWLREQELGIVALSHVPRISLLDLVMSAYLQGVKDGAQAAPRQETTS
jgi:hypothetical protein